MFFNQSYLQKLIVSGLTLGTFLTPISCGSNNVNNTNLYSDVTPQETFQRTDTQSAIKSDVVLTPKAIIQMPLKNVEFFNPTSVQKMVIKRGLGFGKDYCWELVYGEKCILN